MNIILTERWPQDVAFADGDPALPGQVEWCRLIPKVHRALAGFTEPTLFPRFRCDFEVEEAKAYWEAANFLLVRLIGWEPASARAEVTERVLPFPVHIVSAGNIRDNLLDASRVERWASIGIHSRDPSRRGRSASS
jgi:hypothetical protein